MSDREEMPPDLWTVLRSTPIGALPQDENLLRALEAFRGAPGSTASGWTPAEWATAWGREWQRANRAELENERLREALRKIAEYAENGPLSPSWILMVTGDALGGLNIGNRPESA